MYIQERKISDIDKISSTKSIYSEQINNSNTNFL